MEMYIEYDETKNADNVERRGLSFELVRQFEWLGAHIEPDTRRDYGEPRFLVTGFIGERLYRMVFTPRGDKVRVISLRRANQRERKRYVTQTKP